MSEPDIDSSDSSYDSSSIEETRPNRFKGIASTWLTLTGQERGLASSLEQVRNEDLSLHLYNAHVLRARAREAELSEEVIASQIARRNCAKDSRED